MNRARIALLLHLDLLTWETGPWSLTYGGTCSRTFELAFCTVARCNGEIIGRKLFSDQVSFTGQVGICGISSRVR
jgi:hypothetical protein